MTVSLKHFEVVTTADSSRPVGLGEKFSEWPRAEAKILQQLSWRNSIKQAERH